MDTPSSTFSSDATESLQRGGTHQSPPTTPGSSRHSPGYQCTTHLPEDAVKLVADLNNFLALGCLCFEGLLPPKEQDGNIGVWHEITSTAILGQETTISSNLTKLLHAGWIRIQYSRCSPRPQWFIFRIYLLYQDVGLREIDRSNRNLLAALESIVLEINTEIRAWNGYYSPEEHRAFDCWASQEKGNPSLFYLFNQIPSPSPSCENVEKGFARQALEDVLGRRYSIQGLKTSLYPYQHRSAGAMLQRESTQQLNLDPRLEERIAPDGSTFYYSSRDFQFFREPKFWETPRGGVLAESMGLGKTVICLALILATKNHLPSIPKQHASVQVRSKTGSLAQMAISAINRSSYSWKVEIARMRAYGQRIPESCEYMLDNQPPTYRIPGVRHRWNRHTVLPAPQDIIIASTTIIVVPANLIKQWRREIDKHVEVGALKVLVVDDRKVLLPPPEQLRAYDIKLHFKRLIVDEGHFFSNKNTSSTIRVAKNLVKADNRWVVSGTPAKDLLGVDIGLESADSRDELLERRKTFDSRHDVSGAIDSVNALASNFLQSTPWQANDAKLYIYRHMDFRNKTYSGFSTSFRRVLENIVIKTRPEDVDIDIPPFTHQVKLLEPSFYDKLTANLFTLVLTANAVTSERTDADYLFHKNSAKDRYRLVSNLRQSAFFWSGFSEADLDASIKNSTNYLAKESTGCVAQDRQLLLGALDSAKALLEAQKYVNLRLHLDDPGDGMSGAGIRSLAPIRCSDTKAAEGDEGSPKAKGKTENAILTKSGIIASSLRGEPLKRRSSISSPGKPPSSRHSPTAKRRKVSKSEDTAPPSKEIGREAAITDDTARLPDDSPYSWARIVGTTSSKLSYLLSQIVEHYSKEKILVFYTGDNAAWYIAQCLELFNIKHEIYAKSLSAEKKAQYVESFQEKEELRVMLMDVGQAAFGLNICAASRIYFVNPICRPHLESQAIKRAHRIGQLRKVTVETLVLRGSIEEKMLDRSWEMSEAEHKEAKVLEDDLGIKAIIQSARPLPLNEAEASPGLARMAPLDKPEQLWCRPGWREGTVAGSPSRKRKRSTLKDATDPHEIERTIHEEHRESSSHPQVQVKRYSGSIPESSERVGGPAQVTGPEFAGNAVLSPMATCGKLVATKS
ncbi:putative ATP-dependent helicase C17A2.12, partial [Pseudocercospora fuligena]